MPTQLTAEDFKQSLNAHVAEKGSEIYAKFGPRIGWNELMFILEDRAFCRYPCQIRFDADPLLPGELAHPVANSDRPEEGFTMFVNPFCCADLNRAVLPVLYQLVAVNYGEFASSDDAETFGACALGITKDDYYRALCEMDDQAAAASSAATPHQAQPGNQECLHSGNKFI